MSDPWVFPWNFGAQVLKLFCSVRYEDYELYMRLLGEAGAMRVLMLEKRMKDRKRERE